jgi:hypothetical protein
MILTFFFLRRARSFGGGHGGSVVLWLDALCLCAMCNQYDKADAYHSLNADHKHNF